MLQERGQASGRGPITKYLPDYPTHGQTITIENLLTHTSGIPSYTGLPEWYAAAREDMSPWSVIDLFKDKPLEFDPGAAVALQQLRLLPARHDHREVSGKNYAEAFSRRDLPQAGHDPQPLWPLRGDHPPPGLRIFEG